jgi:hypothetical protein
MKRARFVELHRAAIQWPESRFTYIGIDMDGDNSQARQGEVSWPIILFLGLADTLL